MSSLFALDCLPLGGIGERSFVTGAGNGFTRCPAPVVLEGLPLGGTGERSVVCWGGKVTGWCTLPLLLFTPPCHPLLDDVIHQCSFVLRKCVQLIGRSLSLSQMES